MDFEVVGGKKGIETTEAIENISSEEELRAMRMRTRPEHHGIYSWKPA
jgi:hypothetical protein